MPRPVLSVTAFCHRLGKRESKRSFMGNSSNSWVLPREEAQGWMGQAVQGGTRTSRSHASFPKLELGLGHRPSPTREPPTCSICLERLREPISLDCGHDFCIRCFSTHRIPGCELPCCPECRKICKQRKGLRSLGERMKLLPQRPLPPALQETCAVRAERLLLVRINASGGLILRMGAINRCLKHPLARDTPVCLLAVLGEQHSGKSFLLDHLLSGLPSLESGDSGRPRAEGSLPGIRWGANGLTRGIWMWSHPFLLGKEGKKVAVFLVDTGDVMSPELSKETRVKLCALTMMLSSYQILNTSQELKDTDLGYLEMFVHVAEVMGKHYGMVPIQVRQFLVSSILTHQSRLPVSGPFLFQHLDLLVRDSSHHNKSGQGHVGDILQKLSGKYPKVQELLLGKRARCYLLPAPERQWVNKDQASPRGNTEDDFSHHFRAYILDVLSTAPQHAKSRCQGYWSEGRAVARGDRRLLTGQQLAQEIKNLSGWMGKTGPSFNSPDEMAAQLHDLRKVEAAKKEFEEYVRQQDIATKRIFSALRVLPDTMRNLLSTQKDAILARHGVALLCKEREQTLEALEAELQAEAKAFMDSYTMRFCGHLAAVGGAVGAGLMGLAGGVVGAGMAAAALAAEAGMVAAGAAVGATGAAVVGGGVGAGLAATVGCMEKEEDERVQGGDREPLLQEE
ncbi:RING finger protein 112 isoform X1 [Mus musculus]|uniref:Isoform 3 of RING finger protein 112 n=3 Tax=Mus musculus TaxID=10090 RepID=Q96DY5-3|nr:RING finger protein 112 isoform 3 [Mus musculus]XP_006533241.1 RING finger protein 112 isoform X1 [Mus musculus]AAH37118.1 Rnf112 protein [Mus musculus]|eukprot:XP_006533241.1 PREDICTED: RING finger protein 112 isoform X1 [Mus musculus]